MRDNFFTRILRSRYKARPHEANDLINVGGSAFAFSKRKYSDIYLWLIFNKIFSGIRSVHFTNSSDNVTVDAIARFLEDNAVAMVWQWYNYGFIAVDMTKGNYRLVRADRVRKDDGGHVAEPEGRQWVVIYSDEYIATRRTAIQIVANELNAIDIERSAEDYLTHSLGCIGVISSKDMAMLADDKKAFLDDVKRNIGITPDRYQFLISTTPVDYTPIKTPIAELDLGGKVSRTLQLICDYFCVPFDLVSFSGASTYANQEQAVKMFYSGCISSLAEILLQVGRYIIRRDMQVMETSAVLSFTIDNTTIAVQEEEARAKQLSAMADVATKLSSLGVDVSDYLKKIQKKLDNEN